MSRFGKKQKCQAAFAPLKSRNGVGLKQKTSKQMYTMSPEEFTSTITPFQGLTPITPTKGRSGIL